MNINAIINDQLWKAVPGFPCYDVHPTGLIRNAITGKILSQHTNYGGGKRNREIKYPRCKMCDVNGNWKDVWCHRIVALTFIDIPAIEDEDNWTVDHIDHDTTNNDVRNLRWLPAKLNSVLRRNVSVEAARLKILEYYREHDIDYDYFNLLSEL